ncbi:MAG: GntR family transcriptional regulator [Eubacteriales bacterium]
MSENKFASLEKKILARIKNGTYPPGRPIPSERILAESEGMSRMTVRQAISDLVQQGVLFRQQGRGTFVSANKFTENNLMSFSKAIANKGKTPSTQVLMFSLANASDFAETEPLLGDQKIYLAKRLRLADDIPVAVETVYIPFVHSPNLKKEMLKGSLHDLMREKYDLEPKTCELSVSATLCTETDQRVLRVTKNTPVLNIRSKYFSTSGELIYIEKAAYRGDMYEYILFTTKGQASPTP